MTETLQFFKALSDETRLRLLFILNRFELNVNELMRFLGMGQSRVSRHLKILSDAGLLTFRRDGLWVFYSAERDGAGRKFIDSVVPFLSEAKSAAGDLTLAAGIIEERAIKTSQFFNTIALDWDNMAREILGNFKLEDEILDLLPKECATVVDLGCGTGVVLACLLRKAHLAIGVDGSPSMLELARRRFAEKPAQVSLRIGDLEHLPLADAEADFACINLVLHHLSSPISVLREAHRVLKPGGTLVLSDFDKHNDESLRTDYGDRWLGFTVETIDGFLKEAGFALHYSAAKPVEKNLAIHFYQAKTV